MNQLTLFEKNGVLSKLIDILTKSNGWYSERCSLFWDRKYMGNDRNLFHLKTNKKLETQILPTPIAGDWKGQRRKDGTANMLSGKATLGLLPTPDANIRGARKNQNGHQVTLQDVVAMNTQEAKSLAISAGMLPTPTASDYLNGTEKRTETFNRDCDLKHYIAFRNGKPTQLNPKFVEEMMGFPENWTSAPFKKY